MKTVHMSRGVLITKNKPEQSAGAGGKGGATATTSWREETKHLLKSSHLCISTWMDNENRLLLKSTKEFSI